MSCSWISSCTSLDKLLKTRFSAEHLGVSAQHPYSHILCFKGSLDVYSGWFGLEMISQIISLHPLQWAGTGAEQEFRD